MNKIVAVVGMCGSGKSVATELFEKYGYQKVYFGQVTFDILKERGIERTAESEQMIREELRASGDKGIYAKIYYKRANRRICSNTQIFRNFINLKFVSYTYCVIKANVL